jgi:hypothetical protein
MLTLSACIDYWPYPDTARECPDAELVEILQLILPFPEAARVARCRSRPCRPARVVCYPSRLEEEVDEFQGPPGEEEGWQSYQISRRNRREYGNAGFCVDPHPVGQLLEPWPPLRVAW